MSRRVLALVLTAIACGVADPPEEPSPPARPKHLKAIGWRCRDVDVVFFPSEPGRGRLQIAEETRDLMLRPDPTGWTYADDRVAFRMIGDEARLTLGGADQVCLFDAVRSDFEDARVRGVGFRAIGDGWIVEIADEITLTRPGQAALGVPAGAPTTEASGVLAWSGSAGAHALTVTAIPTSCIDRKTDWVSGWSVTIGLDGASLQGCGERLDGIGVDQGGATEAPR